MRNVPPTLPDFDVGKCPDNQRDTAGTISFIANFFEIGAVAVAGPARDCPIDIVLRHIIAARGGNGRSSLDCPTDRGHFPSPQPSTRDLLREQFGAFLILRALTIHNILKL